jgi:glycosyltransferase involved in cell wall biosynthesis
MLNIGRLLQKIGDVSLVIVGLIDNLKPWRQASEEMFTIAHVVDAELEPWGIVGRLRHEFDPRFLGTIPFGATVEDRCTVLNLLAQHDVAWVFGVTAADLLRIYHWPRTVIDIDDIPSRLHHSWAKVAPTRIRRLLEYRHTIICRRREQRLPQRFSVLMVCSEDDRKYLGIPGTRILPNGFEAPTSVVRKPGNPPRLGFIGNFQWMPNAEGVEWFCKEVWPLVRRRLPNARFRVAGHGSEAVGKWGGGIEALGRIGDAAPEIATWSVMVVPVRIGGGTRIKILEGFARQCPIVATTWGAFGYGLVDGEELFMSDEPDAFAARCIELIQMPERAKLMAERAYRKFLKSWTWDSYVDIVRAALEDARQSG